MRKTFVTLLAWLFAFLCFYARGENRKVSLNSSHPEVVWQLKPDAAVKDSGFELSTPGYVMSDYVKGVVPGIVFTAYVEAGLEKDPNFGDHIYQVDESFYNRPFWYRTEFEMPSSFNEGERVWLHFDNTNRFADFFFNGEKISGTASSTKDVSGHMIRSKFDVTGLMNKSGKNAVAVLIYDANQKKTRDAKEAFGISASPTYLSAAGWDWMPYVPGRLNGITGNVYLEITGDVIMEDPWIRSELESNETAYLAFQTAVSNTSDKKRDITVSIHVQPGDIEVSQHITLDAGETGMVYMSRKQFEALIVKEPQLWWPNGYGDPNLYTCKVTCQVEGVMTDAREITFGIRKYEYRFERNAAGWPVMTFYINGQKLFIKGGNWGMSEYLLRTLDEEYAQKIRLHKEMNYNMIRLWTGCVTDDAFYDYCDLYGIMVWDDFWLYVAYNEVENAAHFKQNALDKVRRLRNHPSIALWCGANETHPAPELDNYLRGIVGAEDHNDRMYKSSSNQDGLSGSGWWGNQPPKHHFDTSGSNLAWNNPPYPYGSDRGYGLRSEIGTATFPVYESVRKFIPEELLWPLPTDKQLEEDDDNVWNSHFFGKAASNANPIHYKRAVNDQFGESDNLEAFCEKAQFLNMEVMKGMYEAWNDKMWNDATGILIWMSQSAYPSFVWQTYDYYYDASGSFWGAKKACEPLHIQWNASGNNVKVINSSSNDMRQVTATARIFNLNGREMPVYGDSVLLDVPSASLKEAFQLNFNPSNLATGKKMIASSEINAGNVSSSNGGGAGSRWESATSEETLTPLHFIHLTLKDAEGQLISENFYWRNGVNDLDYTDLNELPATDLSVTVIDQVVSEEEEIAMVRLKVRNNSSTISFGNRLRLVNRKSGERVLPVMMNDNYFTLMPGEEKLITMEADAEMCKNGVDLLLKQYNQKERKVLRVDFE